MPPTARTGYRLEDFDTRARLQLPIERLDPLMEIAALDQAHGRGKIGASDVFASTKHFPFVRENGVVRSAILELTPGFVLRDDGRIFSRRHFPDGPADGHSYHFQAGVAVAEGGGRAALEAAARLIRDQAVEALYLGPRLRPQLDHSVSDACGPDFVAMPADPRLDGRGVVIGIVDYGCDFAHRNFRKADGGTRLLALWDQNGEGGIPEADYGREYDAATIDRALAAADPYAALGYDPHANYYTPGKVAAAHGTHVLDIAAGNGTGTGCPGMAPAADIIFVQLRRYDWTGDPDLNRTAAVLDAVAYVFARAGDRPAVVNLSLGTNGGSHDGTSIVERTLDIFLRVPGRAIVVAAGNAGSAALHATGEIEPGGRRRLGWRFPARDRGPNQLEIWADGPLAVELTAPRGRRLGTVEPGATGTLARDGVHTGAVIGSRRVDADLEVTTAVIRPDGRAEDWTVELVSRSNRPTRFDAWIDRDDPGQSSFADDDAHPECTLASLACGRETIVVGAHYALAVNRDLAHFSARGATRDGRDNPHLTAPGCNVHAARSKADRPPRRGRRRFRAPRVAMSGTSMAAPHVTGAVALLLQKHPQASAAAIRQALVEAAARPASQDGWHAGHGFGRLDLAAACAGL